jgi:sulfur-carrier protein adenylyltransferase/sulfurtransferase
VAAQYLNGRGFQKVYSLEGGIKAWQGLKAVGPLELNLDLIRGDESPIEMIEISYGLEEALQKFYFLAGKEIEDNEAVALLKKLGEMEEKHKQLLMARYAELKPGEPEGPKRLEEQLPQILEGGFKFTDFLSRNEENLKTVPDVLMTAMMIETQSLDLYLRFALKTTEDSTQEILYRIGEEEKTHLSSLGVLLEKKV